jgi:hypothetical protein
MIGKTLGGERVLEQFEQAMGKRQCSKKHIELKGEGQCFKKQTRSKI